MHAILFFVSHTECTYISFSSLATISGNFYILSIQIHVKVMVTKLKYTVALISGHDLCNFYCFAV
jgi:hypothetical protein